MRCFQTRCGIAVPCGFSFASDTVNDNRLEQVLIVVCRQCGAFVLLNQCALTAAFTAATDF